MDKTILITFVFMIPIVQMMVYTFDLTDHFILGEISLGKTGMAPFALLILEWFLLCAFGIISGKWELLIEAGTFPALTAATMVRIILYEFEKTSDDLIDEFEEFEDSEPSYVIAVPDPGSPGTYIIMKDHYGRRK